MGETADRVDEHRKHIEQTRAEMGHTLRDLACQLNPQRVKETVTDTVRESIGLARQELKPALEATAEVVSAKLKMSAEETVELVSGKLRTTSHQILNDAYEATVGRMSRSISGAVSDAGQKMSDVGVTVKGVSMNLIDEMKQRPILTGLCCLGLYVLLAPQPRRMLAQTNPGELMHTMQDRAGDLVDSLQDKASDLKDQLTSTTSGLKDQLASSTSGLRSQMQQTTSGLKDQAGRLMSSGSDLLDRLVDMIENNPLLLGALFAGIGLGLGMLLPETRQEHRLMGQSKETLVEQAQDAAMGLGREIKSAAADALLDVLGTVEQPGKPVEEKPEVLHTQRVNPGGSQDMGKPSSQNLGGDLDYPTDLGPGL